MRRLLALLRRNDFLLVDSEAIRDLPFFCEDENGLDPGLALQSGASTPKRSCGSWWRKTASSLSRKPS